MQQVLAVKLVTVEWCLGFFLVPYFHSAVTYQCVKYAILNNFTISGIPFHINISCIHLKRFDVCLKLFDV